MTFLLIIGVAVDARFVKSASRPVSKDWLKELKEKFDTLGGKLDKAGSIKKFSRDLDSDWTIKNDDLITDLKSMQLSILKTDSSFRQI